MAEELELKGRWALGAPPPGGCLLARLPDTEVTWELWLRKVNRLRRGQIWYQLKLITSPEDGERRKANFWMSYDYLNDKWGHTRDLQILRENIKTSSDVPGGAEDVIAWARRTVRALHESGDTLDDVPHVLGYRGEPGVQPQRPSGPGTKHMSKRQWEELKARRAAGQPTILDVL